MARRRLRLLIFCLIFFTLLNSANNSQPAAFLPGVALDLGVGETWVGAFFSFQTIGQLLGTVIAPSIVKLTQDRVKIVVYGGALLCVNTLVMGIVCLATARTVPWWVFITYFCTGRFINGIVGGTVSVVGLSVLLKIMGERHAATYVGLMEAANMIGNIFGPTLGGVIAQGAGFPAPFWTYSALLGLNSAALLFSGGVPGDGGDIESAAKEEGPKAHVDAWQLYSKPAVLATLFANGIVMLPMALVEPTLEPYAASSPTYLTPGQVGLVLAAMSIGAISAALLAGAIAKRGGQILPTVVGYILIAAGMSLFAYAPKVSRRERLLPRAHTSGAMPWRAPVNNSPRPHSSALVPTFGARHAPHALFCRRRWAFSSLRSSAWAWAVCPLLSSRRCCSCAFAARTSSTAGPTPRSSPQASTSPAHWGSR